MMANYAAAAFVALGVVVVVAAAPVGGALLGASLTGSTWLGGAAGFGLGMAALPVPYGLLITKDDTGNGKSRTLRVAEEIVGLYKSVGEIAVGITRDVLGAVFKKKPAPFVPRVDNDDPYRLENGGAETEAQSRLGSATVSKDFAAVNTGKTETGYVAGSEISSMPKRWGMRG